MSYHNSWNQLHRLLSSEKDGTACVHQTWPDGTELPFFEALSGSLDGRPQETGKAMSANQILRLGGRLARLERMADHPVVAVAGMLNAGKSSLIASFLSGTGRRRVLRGESNPEGSHRFVLWVPQSWKDDREIWSLFHDQLREVFGRPAELLADDTAAAYAQQNNRDGGPECMGVPLVATDPSLDRFGLGLLDCPDVQTGMGTGDSDGGNIGLDFVAKAAPLCSAFVVVSRHSDARDRMLQRIVHELGDRMPGVSRFLAVNRIHPRYRPSVVREDVTTLLKVIEVAGSYGAYDYDIAHSAGCIPPLPPGYASDDTAVPVFYEVCSKDEENPPNQIADDRFLLHVTRHLDKARLFRDASHALWDKISRSTRSGLASIGSFAEQQEAQAAKHGTAIKAACLQLLGHQNDAREVDGLRLRMTEKMASQLTESLTATAPWYIRLLLRCNTKLRSIHKGMKKGVDLLQRMIRRSMDEEYKRFKEMLREGHGQLVTPEELVRALRAEGIHEPGFDRATVQDACQRAIDRFRTENDTEFDIAKLHKAATDSWKQVSMLKKAAVAVGFLGVLATSLAAVLFVPFDFGTTSVLVFATVSELLTAGSGGFLMGGLMAVWLSSVPLKGAEQQTALQQFADFYAIVCDSLGLPRRVPTNSPPTITVGGREREVPESRIPPSIHRPARVKLWTLNEEFKQRFDPLLANPNGT